MKHQFYFILFILLSFSIPVLGDTIPIEGAWSEKGLRSLSPIPFIVKKEVNTLYIYSNKAVDNVYIRIVSMGGDVFQEEVYTFSVNEAVVIPLNNLPAGSYILEFSHRNGYLSGEFSKS